jgi:hypothetical protein
VNDDYPFIFDDAIDNSTFAYKRQPLVFIPEKLESSQTETVHKKKPPFKRTASM